MEEKRSLWKKIKDLFDFGNSYIEYEEEYLEIEDDDTDNDGIVSLRDISIADARKKQMIEEEEEPMPIEPPVQILPIDLFETHDAIYITAFTSGARKNDVQIALSRSAITINVTRQEPITNSYRETRHVSELVWGDFERIIELPDEVDIDNTEAREEYGLLTIKMPKVDKERSNRVRVQ